MVLLNKGFVVIGIFKGFGESVVAAKCPRYTPAIGH